MLISECWQSSLFNLVLFSLFFILFHFSKCCAIFYEYYINHISPFFQEWGGFSLALFILASETNHFYYIHFIHKKYEQFVGQRKKSTNFWQKIWPWRRNKKKSTKGINLLKSAYGAENENFPPFFTIRTKMALARPILELDLYFFLQMKIKSKF